MSAWGRMRQRSGAPTGTARTSRATERCSVGAEGDVAREDEIPGGDSELVEESIENNKLKIEDGCNPRHQKALRPFNADFRGPENN